MHTAKDVMPHGQIDHLTSSQQAIARGLRNHYHVEDLDAADGHVIALLRTLKSLEGKSIA